jgi:hypothetical protein
VIPSGTDAPENVARAIESKLSLLPRSARQTRFAITFALLWAVAWLFSLPPKSRASVIEFVIDGSGAMASPLEGKPRINHLEEILRNSLATIPGEWQVALRVYSGEKCGQSRLLAPPSLEKDKLPQLVGDIQASGVSSPFGALLQARQDLARVKEGKVIVLIGAVHITCDEKVTESSLVPLAAGVRTYAITIGSGELRKWEILARAIQGSGGKIFPVKNLKDLEDTLNSLLQRETANVHFFLSLPLGFEFYGGTLQIFNRDGEVELSLLFEGSEAFVNLKPGEYRARAISDEGEGEKRFILKRDERIQVKIELSISDSPPVESPPVSSANQK